MRKLFILLFIAVSFSSNHFSIKEKYFNSTIVGLNIGEINIDTKDNYDNLSSSSNGKTQNPGEPEIPTYSFNYSINREKEYDVEIIKNEYVLYENINLFPSQPLLKVGEDKIFIKNDDLYNSNIIYMWRLYCFFILF